MFWYIYGINCFCFIVSWLLDNDFHIIGVFNFSSYNFIFFQKQIQYKINILYIIYI